MDFDIQSMKQRARILLRHTSRGPWLAWGILLTAYVIACWWVIAEVASESSSILYIFAIPAMEIAYIPFRVSSHWYSLRISREESTCFADTFRGWQRPFSALFAGIVKDICIIVGFFLLYIGAFLTLYWFRFSTHIIREEDLGVFSAMKRSKQLLKGHYKELFKLDISNIGWFLLAIFTGGLATPCIKPYLSVIYAEFYDYLKGLKNITD